MAKSTSAKKHRSANRPDVIAARTVPAAPSTTAPSPPNGFTEPDSTTTRAYSKPTSTQRTYAEGLATELETAHSYHEYFGTTAPDPAKIAERVHTAAGWDAQYNAAFRWMRYTLAMRMFAWHSALGTIGNFRETFSPVVRRSADAAQLYPEASKFFGVKTAQAKKANKTRVKNKKAKGKTPAK